MANILDYMIWRGDLTFEERPFNEVDNLIFTEFAYLAMDGIVPGMADMGIEMKSTAEKDYRMTVGDICRRYRQEGRSQSDMINDPGKMLDLMEKCPRFRTIRTDWFVNEIDQEKQIQFSAVTFWLDEQNVFVAYRGTDSTIVGWREDFTIS